MDSSAAPHLLPAAARFLELEGEHRADYSGCIILVPHHHAGQDFRRALRHAVSSPILLPPRLITLPELARNADLSTATEPHSRRLAEMHDFLRRTGHLPEQGLWQAAQELATLLETLDAAQADLGSETAQQAIGQHGSNPYLSLEATIAQQVWRAMSQGAPGRARAYGLCLGWLAEHARQPLYTLGLMGISRQEEAFLNAWARHHPVHVLPAPIQNSAMHALLEATWCSSEPNLQQRATSFRTDVPDNPLEGSLTIHSAHNLETTARIAEQVLLSWLAEGRSRIALVALDRLLARRLRALLERRDILIQDETGWAFSTSAVSHVLERWLGLAGGRIWHKDLVDLLKSPFVFADAPAIRTEAVHGLAAALRRHGAPADLAGYQTLARQEDLKAALPILERLARARSQFTAQRKTLGEWSRDLLISLDVLGAHQALAADPIGVQLLDLLARLELEVSGLNQRFTLADWRRWLFLHLEQTTFTDTSVESPIRLTHLAAAHHRDFDGVLILGAGTAHLPGGDKAGLFNDNTLRQMGLPGREEKERIAQDMLKDLLCRAPRTAFIWQAESDGDPAPLSPWLVHLEAFHQAAWQASLIQELAVDMHFPAGNGATSRASPRAPRPPSRLSVSAWQSLVACPYQFFARHILALNEQDEMPEEMDKAEYGSLVHRILARFHTEHPRLENAHPSHWEARLAALSAAVFAHAEKRNFQATAWRQRWERHIPDYVAWALGHEAAGWRFQSAETPLEKAVPWGEGHETLLYGRADRLDHKQGELAVLDYKTQARQTLLAKLDPAGEDVQLAAYAWLAAAAEAGFITVDEKKVDLLKAAAGDALRERGAAEAERIAATMEAMAAGQALPAHGAPGTCTWCEMEGLCRRAHRDGSVP